MARILPFYRTGGLLSGGGGGGSSAPNGVVLGPYANWAALPVSADTGALAIVTSIGAGNASGVAVWDGTEWQLYSGIFDTFADMTAFAEPITVGAVVSVEASGDNNENGVRYQYDGGAWARTAALTNGYAWALSSISNIDPSGVGATKAGDFGLLNGRLYRLTVPLALPGGGTQAYWVAPEVYAGSVTVGAYLVGTEVVSDAVALNLQGWPTVTRTNGTITSQSPRVRLATSGNNGSVLISALTANNVITPSTKVYIRFLMRAAVGNGTMTAVTNVGIPAFGDGSNYIVGAYLSSATSKGTFFWEGVGTSSTGVDRASQAAVAGLSSADDLVEVIVNTTQGLRTCEMWRNGVLVSTTNVFASPFSDQVTLRAVSGSTAGAQTATLDISQVVVMTWA
jgi:hypothetical protein